MRIALAAADAAAASALLVVVTLSTRAAADEGPPSGSATAPPREVPSGYFRDERGRLMQTDFDMNRRLWLGGGWAPGWFEGRGGHVAEGEIDLGARIDATADEGRWRGRFHLLEGQVELGPAPSAHGTLFSYDESRRVDEPVLRLTTFWPRPARHDLYLSLGFWAELMTVDARPRGTTFTRLRPVASGLTWDLWHSRTMQNVLRLRLGAGVDDTVDGAGTHSWAATGIGHLEFDALLDRRGFHRLTADAGADAPLGLDKPWRLRTHASAGAGYELIVLAVNDQPITLRVGGRAGYRNDLPGVKAGFDAEGNAGLRLNLWAPPPRSDPPSPAPAPPRAP